MAYDALFKELLRTFFREFMERFFPEEAARLDFSQITFLEQEIATDVGSGRQRTLDLIAQAGTRSGAAELILIHVEFEARHERDFPSLMCEHYGILRRRHRVPVLPIVVYITGGRGEEKWEEYRDKCLDETIVLFRFLRLRLKGLKAKAVVQEANPLAAALGVLGDRRGADLATVKATSLQTIGGTRLDEARQWLLVNFVQTYLPLRTEEEQRYQEMLAREEHRMAKQVQVTWGDRMRLETKREDVLRVLQARFSAVPEALRRRIEGIDRPETLDALLERAATANVLDEVQAALPN